MTPTGLHYLVAHWDIPPAEPESRRLSVGGRVRRPVELRGGDSRSTAPHATRHAVRRQRSRLATPPVSLPWLGEAIGSAEWAGTPLRALLEDAGVSVDAGLATLSGRAWSGNGGNLRWR